jgi:3-oxoacyl-[acyl-carrier protein] reductase
VTQRTALVTGASRGIGAAVASRLARDGLDVVVHYHQAAAGADATRRAVEAAGRRAWVLQADLTQWEEAERLFREISRVAPGVDVLVNNAGVYPRKYLHETTPDDWTRVLAANVGSQFYCAKLAAPHMIEQEWGRIINLSSVLGVMGSRHGAAYASSKAAILGLTKSLARELAPHGITANAVAPGAIETDILRSDTPETRARRLREIPAGQVGQPDDVAAAVAFLARDEAHYINGQTIHVNGAFLLP